MTETNIPAQTQHTKIYAEQLRAVYRRFTPALLGTSLAALLLVALQWNVVDHTLLLTWLAAMIIVTVLRAGLVTLFIRQNPDDLACTQWGRRFFISSVLAGIIWSVGVYIAFPVGNLPYQLTLTVIIIGLSAGATSTISMVMPSFVAFVFPMMTTLIVLFLLEAHYSSYIITVALTFTLLFVFRGAMNIYKTNIYNIRLRIEAEMREQDLVSASNEAEKANRTKSEFLANMSHEIRTPLHGILSFAQFGLDKLGSIPDEKIAIYFSQISTSGHRLKLLLDDLLDLSKLEAGGMIMDIGKADIAEIVQGCIAEQQALIEHNELRIECNFEDAAHHIECDHNRIGQVIANLLSNAIKFSPLGGTISISSRQNNGSDSDRAVLELIVSDQGAGIPEHELETIFKKFLQSSKNRRSTEGTGLGLAISREIIQAHHGRIWCKNGITTGAEFHVIIPFQNTCLNRDE